MWEVIEDFVRAQIVFIVFILSGGIVGILVLLALAWHRLKERIISVDRAIGIIAADYTNLDFSKIKEGTLEEVWRQMRPQIFKRLKEGTFTAPSPFKK